MVEADADADAAAEDRRNRLRMKTSRQQVSGTPSAKPPVLRQRPEAGGLPEWNGRHTAAHSTMRLRTANLRLADAGAVALCGTDAGHVA